MVFSLMFYVRIQLIFIIIKMGIENLNSEDSILMGIIINKIFSHPRNPLHKGFIIQQVLKPECHAHYRQSAKILHKQRGISPLYIVGTIHSVHVVKTNNINGPQIEDLTALLFFSTHSSS